MIECPICHVSNDDAARFCLECGQRIQAAPKPANPPPPLANPPAEAPKRPKLHSPMLSGGYEEDEESSKFPERRQKSEAPTTGTGMPERRKGGLRSPLLGGGEEPPEQDHSVKGQSASRSGLHSPLLGGDDSSQNKGRTGFPRRKKFEPDEDFEDNSRPIHKGGLRSPLLGGDNIDDADDSPRRPARPARPADNPDSPKRTGQKLRSPMFDNNKPGAGSYDDYEDDFQPEEIDDPNVLRSPLLAARVPRQDRSAPPQPPLAQQIQQQNPSAQQQAQAPSMPPTSSATNLPPAQSFPQRTPTPPSPYGTRASAQGMAAQPSPLAPPLPQPGAPAQNSNQNAPQSQPPQPVPPPLFSQAADYPRNPQPPRPSGWASNTSAAETSNAPLVPGAQYSYGLDTAQKTTQSLEPTPAQAQAPSAPASAQAPSQAPSQAPAVSQTASSDAGWVPVPGTSAAEREHAFDTKPATDAEPPVQRSRRPAASSTSSRVPGLIGKMADSQKDQEVQEETGFSSPSRKVSSAGGILLIPAVIALSAKGWYLLAMYQSQALLQSIPFVCDQGAQVLLLLCLILFAVNSKAKSR